MARKRLTGVSTRAIGLPRYSDKVLTLDPFGYTVAKEVIVTDQRKSKRFDLKLPLELVRTGAIPVKKKGITRNMSSSGVLFSSEAQVAVGDSIEYLITLPSSSATNPEVRLRCMGKIIRHENESTAAATLERYEFVRK